MPENLAARLDRAHADLHVEPAPYTSPGEHEIVVRNAAVAINPFDWILQRLGGVAASFLTYPAVLGTDCAGEVVEVGARVTRFRVGDRVIGYALGQDRKRNRAAEGAFQRYTVLLDRMASPIPEAMSFEDAAVLPLALSTAACGLFQPAQLGLPLPADDRAPTGRTVLVWGGSTSVGLMAIQLAVAAGFEVVATASPSNFELLQRLGAAAVLDRTSPTIVPDLIDALRGRRLAGAFAIGTGSTRPCIEVVAASQGARVVSSASAPASFEGLRRRGVSLQLLGLLPRIAAGFVSDRVRASRARVRTASVFGSSLAFDEVGPAIWSDFLPAALADGRIVPAPAPLVVGHGLESLQGALDRQRQGVSARKVVVTL